MLSPLAIDRKLYAMDCGKEFASPAVGDRFGDAALLEVLRTLDPAKIKGTLTVAFVTQQWLGARGLQKVLYQLKPDELIYVGRLDARGCTAARCAIAAQANARDVKRQAFKQPPGSGVLIASEKPDAEPVDLRPNFKQLPAQSSIALKTDFSAPAVPSRRIHVPASTSRADRASLRRHAMAFNARLR